MLGWTFAFSNKSLEIIGAQTGCGGWHSNDDNDEASTKEQDQEMTTGTMTKMRIPMVMVMMMTMDLWASGKVHDFFGGRPPRPKP